MLTYQEISNHSGISLRSLRSSASKLELKGIYIGKEKVFNDEEVEKLIRYRNSVTSKYKLYDPRKINILECYFKYGSGLKVAKELNIDKTAVQKAIKEFNKTGEIIVASSLNHE